MRLNAEFQRRAIESMRLTQRGTTRHDRELLLEIASAWCGIAHLKRKPSSVWGTAGAEFDVERAGRMPRMDSRNEIWERQASDPRADRRAFVPAQRARQSITGHIIRYVLGFGLAGAIIALVIVYVIT